MSLPTDISRSRRRRERARRRRRTLRAGVALAVVAAVVLGVWTLGFSPALAAREVAVQGTSLLTTEQVTEAAAVPLGTPMLRVPTDAIAARVEALAPVAAVDVSRRWPATIVVTVTERQAAYARALTERGPYELVDGAGVVYHQVATLPDGLLPVTSASDARLLRDVATVVLALPPAVRAEVVSVSAKGVDEIVLNLDGGATIVWGSAEESALKGQVAAGLLHVKAKVYDVSAPSHPATRT